MTQPLEEDADVFVPLEDDDDEKGKAEALHIEGRVVKEVTRIA